MSYEARGEGSLIIKKESFDKLTQAVLSHLGGSAPESIEDLFNIIGTVEGEKAHEYVIRGKFLSSGVSDGHVAVLSSLKKKKNGKVVINTFDPGPGASVLDSIWGYYN